MKQLICPHCECRTSFEPVREKKDGVDIKESSSTRQIMTSVVVSLYQEPGVGLEFTYAITECAGCGRIFIARRPRYHDDDWESVYPLLLPTVSKDIPEPIQGLLTEAYLCLSVSAYRSSVATAQIAFESLWHINGVSDIKGLVTKGVLPGVLAEYANEVRKWANITKHEAPADLVSKEDAEQLIGFLASILDTMYLQPSKLKALQSKRISSESKK